MTKSRARPATLLCMSRRAKSAAAAERSAQHTSSILDRGVFATVLRIVGFGVAVTLIYAFAPLGRRPDGWGVLNLALCVVALIVVIGLELRIITRSARPALRAVEAVVVILALTLFPFAATYYSLARSVPGSFGVALTRLDAVYFTVTTFATVGFGDIAPKSQTARAVVLTQMLVDLVLIGLIAKVIAGAARQRLAALRAERAPATSTTSSTTPPGSDGGPLRPGEADGPGGHTLRK
jgi:hypothetical protein